MKNKTLSVCAALTCALSGAILSVCPAQAGKPIPVHTFGSGSDGAVPSSGLVKDAQGRLYGVTGQGGAFGFGAVYRLTHTATGIAGWTEETLHSFNNTDGSRPQGKLVFDASGSIYGITVVGGTANRGTVYRLDVSNGIWSITTLHNFGVNTNDGVFPQSGLQFGTDGLLYGTTLQGGAQFGTVFGLSPLGDTVEYSILHAFSGGTDGEYPIAGIVEPAAGVLVGATELGGPAGAGVAFTLTQSAAGVWSEAIVHYFQLGSSDISGPFSPDAITALSDGKVVGCGGHGPFNQGGIFVLQPVAGNSGSWSESVAYFFGTKSNDPNYGLWCGANERADGAILGTTDIGGTGKPDGSGTLFALIPPTRGRNFWVENIYYDFVPGPRGHSPLSPVVELGRVVYGVAEDTSYNTRGPGLAYGIVR